MPMVGYVGVEPVGSVVDVVASAGLVSAFASVPASAGLT
jgi:hypothetical protein